MRKLTRNVLLEAIALGTAVLLLGAVVANAEEPNPAEAIYVAYGAASCGLTTKMAGFTPKTAAHACFNQPFEVLAGAGRIILSDSEAPPAYHISEYRLRSLVAFYVSCGYDDASRLHHNGTPAQLAIHTAMMQCADAVGGDDQLAVVIGKQLRRQLLGEKEI